jgi:uncharacterized protein YbjT (DUF2867 family)
MLLLYYHNKFPSINMKLIITGATGFVGTEVIRQALSNSTITSIIALARKPSQLFRTSKQRQTYRN